MDGVKMARDEFELYLDERLTLCWMRVEPVRHRMMRDSRHGK
jgi:hypothetical protein